MNCDCCGKSKKLLESYAAVNTSNGPMNLCVKCNDLAYKIRDAANDGNEEDFQKSLKALNARAKKSSATFKSWKKDYVDTQAEKLKGRS